MKLGILKGSSRQKRIFKKNLRREKASFMLQLQIWDSAKKITKKIIICGAVVLIKRKSKKLMKHNV